jgi:RND family efflux transporter MFP subunit
MEMESAKAPGPKRLRWLVWCLPCSLLFLLLLLFFPHFWTHTAASTSRQDDPTFRVVRKDLAPSLRLNGTTQSARSYVALTPILEGAQINTLVITNLIAAGAHVKKDDILVEFDPQIQVKDFLDKQNTFVSTTAQVAQKKADEEIAKAKDESALKQAEDDLSRAQLEVQRNEIVSKIDAEKNEEALEEAKATLAQLRETYEHKRASAAAGIHILELQRDRAQEAMRYAQGNSSRMTVRSPMEGVAVFNILWLGGRMRTVQLGDSMRPGMPVLQVVDPSRMEVRANVNQVDLSRLSIGQRAQIRLDAYPALVLPGVLEELSPLGHGGQFSDTIRTFQARLQIPGEDPRLLPDLSAAIDFDLGKREKALVLPRDAVFAEGDKTFVYRQNGSGFDKQAVHVALAGDGELAVDSGLSEGDVVKRQASGETPKVGK